MAELDETQRKKRMSLISQRGALKGRITKLSNYVQNSGKLADADVIARKIDKIKDEMPKSLQICCDLLEIEPDGNHEEEFETIDYDFENLLVLICKFELPEDTRPTVADRRTPESTVSRTTPFDYLHSLPKIETKKFNGSLENWRSYRDWFIQTIHSHEGLSGAQKLDYLKRTLTGEASEMISAFQASKENYAVAWKLLEWTYDIPSVLIFRHCDLLMETPVMKRGTAEELRGLINHVQTQILAMKALGERVENWNTLISHILLRRLDKDTEKEWNRTASQSNIPDYEEVLRFLREQATRLTCMRAPETNKNVNPPAQGKQGIVGQKGNDRRVQSLSTTLSEESCSLCKKKHFIGKCDRFLSLDTPSRIEAARKVQLCLDCLRGNHKTRACKATTCETCRKRHNVLLHLKQEKRQAMRSSSV